MEPHTYNIDLTWDEDRKGTLCSPELQKEGGPCIEVATPPEFPKGMPGIWSPEHFFTAAVSSCLMTTFLAIAENSKLEFSHFSCNAQGKLDKVEGKYMMSEVHLIPVVVVKDEKNAAKAERVLQKSEAACLITHSVKSKVTMTTEIKIEDNEE